METLQTSKQHKSPTLICSLEDFHASPSHSQGNEEDSKTHGARSFMRLPGCVKRKDLKHYSSKMLKACSHMTMEGHSEKYSLSWMNWGMMSNGRFLTANTLESHKIGRGCSLSDILEDQVEDKYFLSDKMKKHVIKKQGKYTTLHEP